MAAIKEVIEGLPNLFVKEKAKGWDRVIEFQLTGDEPCTYTAVIKSQEINIHEGAPTEEEKKMKYLLVFGDSQNVVDMFTGAKPPMELVNAKLIQMKGSIIDSMSFSRIWNIPKK